MDWTIVICGLGHLGGSFLEGFLKSGINPEFITALVRNEQVSRNKYGHTKIQIVSQHEKLLQYQTPNLIFILCVPPKLAISCLKEISITLRKIKSLVFLSAVAGLTYDQVRYTLNHPDPRIGLIMPNIAISVNKGCTTICKCSLDEETIKIICKLFSFCEKFGFVDSEEDMYKTIYLCGSFVGILPHIMSIVEDFFPVEDCSILKKVTPSLLNYLGSYLFPNTNKRLPVSLLETWQPIFDTAVKTSIDKQRQVSEFISDQHSVGLSEGPRVRPVGLGSHP